MCEDAVALGGFWSELLEFPLDDGASKDYAQFSPPEPQAKWLFVRSSPHGNSDRMVVALTSYDLDVDAERAVSLGATNDGRQESGGFEWVEMRDPEGNRFTFNAPPPS
ncbi:VOC family protein [Nocardioides hwasunensis]|nr:VOC family protein [Nocardioides hwasunensis]